MENHNIYRYNQSHSPYQASGFSSLTETDIVNRLAHAHRQAPDLPYPEGLVPKAIRSAAVLIPILRSESDWHLLFIRRTNNQTDPHSGQVAFPGGAADPGDDHIVATALREANEEIGLSPRDVQVLGRLEDFITITGFQVSPIIGKIPWPYTLSLAQNEVSRAFTIPLRWLADPQNHQITLRELPAFHDPIPVIYFSPYAGEVLWGASARFTLGLIDALGLS